MPHKVTQEAATPLTRDEYKYLSDLIVRQSGLQLGEGKDYLLTSRLEPLAKSMGLRGVGEMVRQMRSGSTVAQDRIVAEALATHETFFFRDPDCFATLRQWISDAWGPTRFAQTKRRIWSAACSTGQEAYALMIMLDELVERQRIGGTVEIIATDFSKPIVEKARNGIFTSFEVGRGLSTAQRDRFFSPVGHDNWQVRDAYRARIKFEQRNLLDGFSTLGPFDLVLCRNVMIYFDVATKADLLRRMHKVITKEGLLVLGASETAVNLVQCYDTLAPNRSSLLKPK